MIWISVIVVMCTVSTYRVLGTFKNISLAYRVGHDWFYPEDDQEIE